MTFSCELEAKTERKSSAFKNKMSLCGHSFGNSLIMYSCKLVWSASPQRPNSLMFQPAVCGAAAGLTEVCCRRGKLCGITVVKYSVVTGLCARRSPHLEWNFHYRETWRLGIELYWAIRVFSFSSNSRCEGLWSFCKNRKKNTMKQIIYMSVRTEMQP